MGDEDRTRLVNPRTSNEEGDDRTRMIRRTDAGATALLNESAASEGQTRTIRVSSSRQGAESVPDDNELVVGWLTVIAGPGKGCSREVFYGMNSIGRSSDERIALDFGDVSISREAHAFIVYDEKQRDYYIQHGGKSNLVRLNEKPVLAPMELSLGDRIEIGATKLIFMPLCGDNFSWEENAK